MRKRQRRSGYTLLEVMLAVGIGLLLVAALYVALDVQMRYMATGRNAVIESQMSRGLLQHVGNDIRGSLALLNTGASWRAAIPPPASASSDSSSQTQTQTDSSQTTDPIGTGQDDTGLYGDEQHLYVVVSRLPRYSTDQSQGQLGFADMRRIGYMLIPGQGLARQEVRNLRSGGDLSGGGEEPPIIIAPEVTELRFRYFDGSANTWVSSWDGNIEGPPRAIEITMTIQPYNANGEVAANRQPTTHRLVVAVPTGAVLPDPTQQGGSTP
jgi:prepilin-type N-terminal cleavage/methylation domain-containing protein